MRLGILGGTFDPIHLSHLRIATIALEVASLDEVHFVTSVRPPHKSQSTHANFLDRHAMVALALQGRERFIPSSIEADRPGKSYSIDTLRYFKRLAGENGETCFIIGLDAYLEITSWKDYDRFPSLCSVLVFTRPGFKLDNLDHQWMRTHSWKILTTRHLPEPGGQIAHGMYWIRGYSSSISSSAIRQRVRRGYPIGRYVPKEVQEYIDKTRLYRVTPNHRV